MMSDARCSPLKPWSRKNAEVIQLIPLAHSMHDEGLGDPDPHGGTTVFAFIFAIVAVQTNALVREECVEIAFPALWVTSVF